MNESVIERSFDVANSENVIGVLAWRGGGRTVIDDLLLLLDVGSLLCSLGLLKKVKEPGQIQECSSVTRSNERPRRPRLGLGTSHVK